MVFETLLTKIGVILKALRNRGVRLKQMMPPANGGNSVK